MTQGKFILLILICTILLDVALAHEPGRGYGASQQRVQGGRGRHGAQQRHGSHSAHGGGPQGGRGPPGGPPGGNPGGGHVIHSGPGNPPAGPPGGHGSSSRDSVGDSNTVPSNDENTDQGAMIPRCLLERKSAVIPGFTISGSRNVTSFIPRCGLDHSFKCHQKWSAVGLSWETDKDGRMVDNTLTKGRPKCPVKKDARQTLVCLHELKRFRCHQGTRLFLEEIKLSRNPAPGDKCRHHAREGYNTTTSVGHHCNVTKVTTNVRSRCQGRQKCWLNVNERLLGKKCAREVKFILVNFTCDQKKSNMEEEPIYMRWFGDLTAICINDDDETTNNGDSDQDFSDDGSGRDSDDNDDGDDDDDDDDDDNDDDGFLDENDDDVDNTFDDDVARFERMGFLGECGLLGRMSHGRHHHREPGPSHRHYRRHHHHHCPRINWIQQPDLYKEFNFNSPSVCPKNQPMQSNCKPNLCRFVKCGEDRNISCRINPCGTCRPSCYDVNGKRAPPPRALTQCEHKRLKMKYYHGYVNIVPRCNDDGSFVETQCFYELCWCVDKHGQERNGTRQKGKPTSCEVSGPVLSQCQSTQLNIKNLKEHLRKMATRYNETANNLKPKAENATLPIAQNQSRQQQHTVRHQMRRERVCRMLVRGTQRMVKYFTQPKCLADGSFESIRCGPSGKKCWCVDENGKMVGFMKSRDKLDCSGSDESQPNICPPVMAPGADQSRPRSCRNNSDCSDSEVCCKTHRGRRGCVDPLPRPPAVKPGKCPKIPHPVNFTCRSQCKSDVDCRSHRKCCGLGCGKRCIPPNMPVCPKDKPFKLCIYDKCLSSPGCPSHPSARCRMNYCGECIEEYFDENDRNIDCSNATKCQKQRYAAIKSYKRKFLQTFNTMPVDLPGAQYNQSRGGGSDSHGGIPRSGGNTGAQRGGSHGTQHGGSWGNGAAWRWGGQGIGSGGQRGQDSGQWGGMRGQQGGSHAGGGTQSGAAVGGLQQGGHGGHAGGQWGGMGRRGRSSHARGGSRGRTGAGGMQQGGHGGQWGRMGRRGRGSHARGGGHGEAGGWYQGGVGRGQVRRYRHGRQVRQQTSQQSDLGVFIPECHPDEGSFLLEQCNVTFGACWCVDTDGHEKPNTRAQVQKGTIDCGAVKANADMGRELQKENEVYQKKIRVARLMIVLTGRFDDVLGKKQQFINHLKDKVASICGCKKEQIQYVEIWRGSIKVKLEIAEDNKGGSLEENMQLLHTEVKSLNFVIIFEDKEYRSDGAFEAYVTSRHDDKESDHSGRLSLVETIAIGSCAAVSLLVSAVFVCRKYFGRSKKEKPVGWKDWGEVNLPEVQYVMPEPEPIWVSGEPCGVKASVGMPEPSA